MLSIQAAAVALALAGVGETVLIDFHAEWCGPCRQMEGAVAQLASRGYPVRKVNIDHDRAMAARFRVEGIPCFVLLVDGQEAGRVVGATDAANLERLFQQAGVGPAGSASAGSKFARQPNVGRQETFAQESVRGQSPDPQPLAVSIPGAESTLAPVADAPLVTLARDPSAYQVEQSSAGGATTSRLMAASVRLRIDDGGSHSVGSGTIIDSREGEALVVTCAHVFRDSQGKGPITVDLFGEGAPQNIPATLVSYDLKSDVGLVSFRPSVPVAVVRVAPDSYRARLGDAVVNIGCNHGAEPTARTSQVAAIDKYLGPPNLVVSGQPVQGRSGGGLFSADGLLIGICNAADPADDEGLYAALASVHAELDRMGLKELCLDDAGSGEFAAGRSQNRADNHPAAFASSPPLMPVRMPSPEPHRSPASLVPTSAGDPAFVSEPVSHAANPADPRGAFAAPLAAARGLTDEESQILASTGSDGDAAEVICIVRSIANPRAKSEIIVLDRASPLLLQQLAAEQSIQSARRLTSIRRPTAAR